ncbi:unnamed protein product [Lathyrus oleraceus]|uniref:uncharacterized protein LOC127132591 n=1 Tax=Pisum sativum TaxID=3888 RepID=UPI0021D234A6|nr:uncharacterized protein LOC127132591 [Pisum sativum]
MALILCTIIRRTYNHHSNTNHSKDSYKPCQVHIFSLRTLKGNQDWKMLIRVVDLWVVKAKWTTTYRDGHTRWKDVIGALQDVVGVLQVVVKTQMRCCWSSPRCCQNTNGRWW